MAALDFLKKPPQYTTPQGPQPKPKPGYYADPSNPWGSPSVDAANKKKQALAAEYPTTPATPTTPAAKKTYTPTPGTGKDEPAPTLRKKPRQGELTPPPRIVVTAKPGMYSPMQGFQYSAAANQQADNARMDAQAKAQGLETSWDRYQKQQETITQWRAAMQVTGDPEKAATSLLRPTKPISGPLGQVLTGMGNSPAGALVNAAEDIAAAAQGKPTGLSRANPVVWGWEQQARKVAQDALPGLARGIANQVAPGVFDAAAIGGAVAGANAKKVVDAAGGLAPYLAQAAIKAGSDTNAFVTPPTPERPQERPDYAAPVETPPLWQYLNFIREQDQNINRGVGAAVQQFDQAFPLPQQLQQIQGIGQPLSMGLTGEKVGAALDQAGAFLAPGANSAPWAPVTASRAADTRQMAVDWGLDPVIASALGNTFGALDWLMYLTSNININPTALDPYAELRPRANGEVYVRPDIGTGTDPTVSTVFEPARGWIGNVLAGLVGQGPTPLVLNSQSTPADVSGVFQNLAQDIAANPIVQAAGIAAAQVKTLQEMRATITGMTPGPEQQQWLAAQSVNFGVPDTTTQIAAKWAAKAAAPQLLTAAQQAATRADELQALLDAEMYNRTPQPLNYSPAAGVTDAQATAALAAVAGDYQAIYRQALPLWTAYETARAADDQVSMATLGPQLNGYIDQLDQIETSLTPVVNSLELGNVLLNFTPATVDQWRPSAGEREEMKKSITALRTEASRAYLEYTRLEDLSLSEIVDESQDVWAMLAANVFLDPLNLLDTPIGMVADAFKAARLARKLIPATDTAAFLARNVDEGKAIAAAMTQTGLITPAVIKKVAPGAVNYPNALAAIFDKTNEAKAQLATNNFFIAFHALTAQLENVEDAKTLLTTLIDNPQQLIDGVALTGEKYKQIGPVVRFGKDVVANQTLKEPYLALQMMREQLLTLPILTGKEEFNAAKFLHEVDQVVFRGVNMLHGNIAPNIPIGATTYKVRAATAKELAQKAASAAPTPVPAANAAALNAAAVPAGAVPFNVAPGGAVSSPAAAVPGPAAAPSPAAVSRDAVDAHAVMREVGIAAADGDPTFKFTGGSFTTAEIAGLEGDGYRLADGRKIDARDITEVTITYPDPTTYAPVTEVAFTRADSPAWKAATPAAAPSPAAAIPPAAAVPPPDPNAIAVDDWVYMPKAGPSAMPVKVTAVDNATGILTIERMNGSVSQVKLDKVTRAAEAPTVQPAIWKAPNKPEEPVNIVGVWGKEKGQWYLRREDQRTPILAAQVFNADGTKFTYIPPERMVVNPDVVQAATAGTTPGQAQQFVVAWLDKDGKEVGFTHAMTRAQADEFAANTGRMIDAARKNPLLKGLQKFAHVQRSFLSTMWLDLRPGHWIRNASAGQLAMWSDGIGTFDDLEDLLSPLSKKFIGGAPTPRIAEGLAGEGGGRVGEQAMDPFGAPQQKVFGTKFVNSLWTGFTHVLGTNIAFGEQAMYARGFAKAWNRAFDAGWTDVVRYQLGPELKRLGVPTNMRNALLDGLYQTGMYGSKSDVAAFVRKFANGEYVPVTVQSFNVDKEVVNDATVIALQKAIDAHIAGSATADQTKAAFATAIEAQKQQPLTVLASVVAQPGSYNGTETGLVEESARIITEVTAVGVAAGLPQAEAQRVAQDLAQKVVGGERAHWDRFLAELAAMPDGSGMHIAFDLMANLYDARKSARHMVDEYTQAAVDAGAAVRESAWNLKWAGTQEEYTQLAAKNQELFDQALDDLRTAMAGGNVPQRKDWWRVFESHQNFTPEELAYTRTLDIKAASGPYVTEQDRLNWDRAIKANRDYVDVAYTRVFEALRRFPDLDALDIARSTIANVDAEGARAAAALKPIRDALWAKQKAGAVSSADWAAYFALRNRTWNTMFDNQVAYNEAAEWAIVANGVGKQTPTGLRWTEEFPNPGEQFLLAGKTPDGRWQGYSLLTHEYAAFDPPGASVVDNPERLRAILDEWMRPKPKAPMAVLDATTGQDALRMVANRAAGLDVADGLPSERVAAAAAAYQEAIKRGSGGAWPVPQAVIDDYNRVTQQAQQSLQAARAALPPQVAPSNRTATELVELLAGNDPAAQAAVMATPEYEALRKVEARNAYLDLLQTEAPALTEYRRAYQDAGFTDAEWAKASPQRKYETLTRYRDTLLTAPAGIYDPNFDDAALARYTGYNPQKRLPPPADLPPSPEPLPPAPLAPAPGGAPEPGMRPAFTDEQAAERFPELTPAVPADVQARRRMYMAAGYSDDDWAVLTPGEKAAVLQSVPPVPAVAEVAPPVVPDVAPENVVPAAAVAPDVAPSPTYLPTEARVGLNDLPVVDRAAAPIPAQAAPSAPAYPVTPPEAYDPTVAALAADLEARRAALEAERQAAADALFRAERAAEHRRSSIAPPPKAVADQVTSDALVRRSAGVATAQWETMTPAERAAVRQQVAAGQAALQPGDRVLLANRSGKNAYTVVAVDMYETTGLITVKDGKGKEFKLAPNKVTRAPGVVTQAPGPANTAGMLEPSADVEFMGQAPAAAALFASRPGQQRVLRSIGDNLYRVIGEGNALTDAHVAELRRIARVQDRGHRFLDDELNTLIRATFAEQMTSAGNLRPYRANAATAGLVNTMDATGQINPVEVRQAAPNVEPPAPPPVAAQVDVSAPLTQDDWARLSGSAPRPPAATTTTPAEAAAKAQISQITKTAQKSGWSQARRVELKAAQAALEEARQAAQVESFTSLYARYAGYRYSNFTLGLDENTRAIADELATAAQREQRTLPAEVLADYPDLAPAASAADQTSAPSVALAALEAEHAAATARADDLALIARNTTAEVQAEAARQLAAEQAHAAVLAEQARDLAATLQPTTPAPQINGEILPAAPSLAPAAPAVTVTTQGKKTIITFATPADETTAARLKQAGFTRSRGTVWTATTNNDVTRIAEDIYSAELAGRAADNVISGEFRQAAQAERDFATNEQARQDFVAKWGAAGKAAPARSALVGDVAQIRKDVELGRVDAATAQQIVDEATAAGFMVEGKRAQFAELAQAIAPAPGENKLLAAFMADANTAQRLAEYRTQLELRPELIPEFFDNWYNANAKQLFAGENIRTVLAAKDEAKRQLAGTITDFYRSTDAQTAAELASRDAARAPIEATIEAERVAAAARAKEAARVEEFYLGIGKTYSKPIQDSIDDLKQARQFLREIADGPDYDIYGVAKDVRQAQWRGMVKQAQQRLDAAIANVPAEYRDLADNMLAAYPKLTAKAAPEPAPLPLAAQAAALEAERPTLDAATIAAREEELGTQLLRIKEWEAQFAAQSAPPPAMQAWIDQGQALDAERLALEDAAYARGDMSITEYNWRLRDLNERDAALGYPEGVDWTDPQAVSDAWRAYAREVDDREVAGKLGPWVESADEPNVWDAPTNVDINSTLPEYFIHFDAKAKLYRVHEGSVGNPKGVKGGAAKLEDAIAQAEAQLNGYKAATDAENTAIAEDAAFVAAQEAPATRTLPKPPAYAYSTLDNLTNHITAGLAITANQRKNVDNLVKWLKANPDTAAEALGMPQGRIDAILALYGLSKANAWEPKVGSAKAAWESYLRQLKANPDKWDVGMGVAWKVTGDQTNRGYRIVSVDREALTAVIRPVRDTGLTATGGNEGVGREVVRLGDLTRAKADDAKVLGEKISVNAGKIAEALSTSPTSTEAAATAAAAGRQLADKDVPATGDAAYMRFHYAQFRGDDGPAAYAAYYGLPADFYTENIVVRDGIRSTIWDVAAKYLTPEYTKARDAAAAALKRNDFDLRRYRTNREAAWGNIVKQARAQAQPAVAPPITAMEDVFRPEPAAAQVINAATAADPTVIPLITVTADEIPQQRALAAFQWNSMNPERGAKTVRDDYVRHLEWLRDQLEPFATTPEQRASIAADLEAYRQGYKQRYLAWLDAQSRTASAMVTGPAKFPTARNDKALAVERKRLEELTAFKDRGIARLQDTYDPARIARAPIASADSEALTKLQTKLAGLEDLQQRMVAANKIVRAKKLTDEEKIGQLMALNLDRETAAGLLKPDFAGRLGFPDYATSNNSAQIRNVKERITEVGQLQARMAAAADLPAATSDARVWTISPEDGKIELKFDKPEFDALDPKLKEQLRRDYNWAPSKQAWRSKGQQNLYNAKETAKALGFGEPGVGAPVVSTVAVVTPAPSNVPTPAPLAPKDMVDTPDKKIGPVVKVDGDRVTVKIPTVKGEVTRVYDRVQLRKVSLSRPGFAEPLESPEFQRLSEVTNLRRELADLQKRPLNVGDSVRQDQIREQLAELEPPVKPATAPIAAAQVYNPPPTAIEDAQKLVTGTGFAWEYTPEQYVQIAEKKQLLFDLRQSEEARIKAELDAIEAQDALPRALRGDTAEIERRTVQRRKLEQELGKVTNWNVNTLYSGKYQQQIDNHLLDLWRDAVIAASRDERYPVVDSSLRQAWDMADKAMGTKLDRAVPGVDVPPVAAVAASVTDPAATVAAWRDSEYYVSKLDETRSRLNRGTFTREELLAEADDWGNKADAADANMADVYMAKRIGILDALGETRAADEAAALAATPPAHLGKWQEGDDPRAINGYVPVWTPTAGNHPWQLMNQHTGEIVRDEAGAAYTFVDVGHAAKRADKWRRAPDAVAEAAALPNHGYQVTFQNKRYELLDANGFNVQRDNGVIAFSNDPTELEQLAATLPPSRAGYVNGYRFERDWGKEDGWKVFDDKNAALGTFYTRDIARSLRDLPPPTVNGYRFKRDAANQWRIVNPFEDKPVTNGIGDPYRFEYGKQAAAKAAELPTAQATPRVTIPAPAALQADYGKTNAMGLTGPQTTYTVDQLQQAAESLRADPNQRITIQVPGDGTVTVTTPKQAEATAKVFQKPSMAGGGQGVPDIGRIPQGRNPEKGLKVPAPGAADGATTVAWDKLRSVTDAKGAYYEVQTGTKEIAIPGQRTMGTAPVMAPAHTLTAAEFRAAFPVAYDLTPIHRTLVRDALAQGRDVPANVLTEYPDLAQQFGKNIDAVAAAAAIPAPPKYEAFDLSDFEQPDGVIVLRTKRKLSYNEDNQDFFFEERIRRITTYPEWEALHQAYPYDDKLSSTSKPYLREQRRVLIDRTTGIETPGAWQLQEVGKDPFDASSATLNAGDEPQHALMRNLATYKQDSQAAYDAAQNAKQTLDHFLNNELYSYRKEMLAQLLKEDKLGAKYARNELSASQMQEYTAKAETAVKAKRDRLSNIADRTAAELAARQEEYNAFLDGIRRSTRPAPSVGDTAGLQTMYGGFGAIDPRPALANLQRQTAPYRARVQSYLQNLLDFGGKPKDPEVAEIAVEQIKSLHALHERLLAALPTMRDTPPNTLTRPQRAALVDYVDKTLLPQFDNTVLGSTFSAEMSANAAMLNYQDRRGIDTFMSLIFPFHYFWTRGGYTWAKRFARKPSLLNAYLAVDRAIETENQRGYLPERLKGTIFAYRTEDGHYRLRNPLRTMIPVYGIDPYGETETSNNVALDWVNKATNVVPGLNPVLGLLLDAVRDQVDPVPAGDVTRVQQALQLRSYLPFAGIAADVRQAVTGEATSPYLGGDWFDQYRVQRTLDIMAQGGAFGANVDAAKARANFAKQIAVNLDKGKDRYAGIPKAQQAQAEQDYKAAGQDVGRQRNLSGTVAFMTGTGASYVPDAEQAKLQAQQAEKVAGYGPNNPYGSVELKRAVQDQNAGLNFNGDTPAASAMSDQYFAQSDLIYAEMQQVKDAAIAKNPNISSGDMSDLTDKYYKQLEQLKVDANTRVWLTANPNATPEQIAKHQTLLKERIANGDDITDWQTYTATKPPAGANVREQALWILERQLKVEGQPVWPGDEASKAEFAKYYAANDAWKLVRDKTITERLLNLKQIMSVNGGADLMAMFALIQGMSPSDLVLEFQTLKFASEVEKDWKRAITAKGYSGGGYSSGWKSYYKKYSSWKKWGRRGYGGYGGSNWNSWGGGGGYTKAPFIPDVYARYFDKGLWLTQSELRRWQPANYGEGAERWRPAKYWT